MEQRADSFRERVGLVKESHDTGREVEDRSHDGDPTSREEILQKIWGVEAGPSNRTVDNFIVKLRKKIERSPDKPEHILTVYGFGYKLAP